MKRLLHDFGQLWQQQAAFRLAAVYLVLLGVVVLVLPWLPLPFAPNHLDLDNLYQPPFTRAAAGVMHWFGTDALGRDVLTETLYGARTGLFISIPVVVVSTLIGLLLGAAAGFFGDKLLLVSRATLLLLPLLLFLIYYLGLYLPLHLQQYTPASRRMWLSWAILAAAFAVLKLLMLPLFQKVPWLRYKITFPLDTLVMRLIEVVASVPWLILVLLLASFMPSSILLLCLILVLTSWTHTARLARAEMLRVKAMPYLEASRTLGFTNAQLIFGQALPNISGPVLVAFSFGIAGLLTLESTLSFLGIGLPPTVVSWGRTITGIRLNPAAWWLVAFPGGLLALTVLALQTLSYYLLSIMRKDKV